MVWLIPAYRWGRQFNPACIVGSTIPKVLPRDHVILNMSAAHVGVVTPTLHVLSWKPETEQRYRWGEKQRWGAPGKGAQPN